MLHIHGEIIPILLIFLQKEVSFIRTAYSQKLLLHETDSRQDDS